MDFLRLVQRLRRKCRVSGTGPVSVLNQNEEYSRLIDFIRDAWNDIQTTREDWAWMRGSCSFQTVAGKALYTPAEIGLTDFGNWMRYDWRSYTTLAGVNSEIRIQYMDYEVWRDLFQIGALRGAISQPTAVTIAPDKSIGLGPTPIAGYTITGDYYRVPSDLVADTDTPALPAYFHMAIVYRAMMFFGVSESAAEVYQEGKVEFERLMRRITMNQQPEILGASPLA